MWINTNTNIINMLYDAAGVLIVKKQANCQIREKKRLDLLESEEWRGRVNDIGGILAGLQRN